MKKKMKGDKWWGSGRIAKGKKGKDGGLLTKLV